MSARRPAGWSLVLGLSLAGVGGCIPDVVPSAGSDGALPPSCAALAPTCGPLSGEDCCASPLVPGGSFTRLDNRDPTDTPHDATVSSFLLDRFEVTVPAGTPMDAPIAFASHGYDAFHLLMPVFACRKSGVTPPYPTGTPLANST